MPEPKEEKPVATPGRRRSREKTRDDLQFAISQINNKGIKLSISAVASEVGVTPALIHNTYPDIAEAIRAQGGRATRDQRDAKISELGQARAELKDLRAQLEAALADIAMLASINETLRNEAATLKATSSGKVIVLAHREESR